MLSFTRKYFYLALILFLIEIVIAVFFRDKFVRYFLGDLLVVIFLYCFIMSWLRLESTKVAFSVLLFSFVIETLQYFNLLNALGWQNNKIAIIILGNSFDLTLLCLKARGFLDQPVDLLIDAAIKE